MKASTIAIALLTATVCAHAADDQATYENDPARAALKDRSGAVERVNGEDPKHYFIANLRALNAIDKNENGIWDDVEEKMAARMKIEPALIKNMDMRPVWQVVRHYEQLMQFETRAEVQEKPEFLLDDARGCLAWMIKSGQLPARMNAHGVDVTTVDYVIGLAQGAILYTRERMLATNYAVQFLGASTFTFAAPWEPTCDK